MGVWAGGPKKNSNEKGPSNNSSGRTEKMEGSLLLIISVVEAFSEMSSNIHAISWPSSHELLSYYSEHPSAIKGMLKQTFEFSFDIFRRTSTGLSASQLTLDGLDI